MCINKDLLLNQCTWFYEMKTLTLKGVECLFLLRRHDLSLSGQIWGLDTLKKIIFCSVEDKFSYSFSVHYIRSYLNEKSMKISKKHRAKAMTYEILPKNIYLNVFKEPCNVKKKKKNNFTHHFL